MKKLFVSVPMEGRTEEEIRKTIDKMKKIAEIFEGEELELIDTYSGTIPDKKEEAILCLAEKIKKMAEADVFIGFQKLFIWENFPTEYYAAKNYKIKMYMISPEYVFENYYTKV